MPAYKDKNNKWECIFYYSDHTGKRKQKHKRGFALKRDAEAWERDFLERVQGSPEMTVSALAALYLENIKHTGKEISYKTRESRVRNWILPYFENKPVNEIKAVDVQLWQRELKKAVSAKNEPLSDTYIGILNRELSLMFNYAIRYYNLKNNPVRIAGSPAKSKKRSLNFWTLEQFKQFIDTFNTADPFRIAFLVLYYTGCRVGELQALTVADIDFKNNRIRINKTFHMIAGKEVITDTKTEKGIRTIYVNPSLMQQLRQHISRIYKAAPGTRVFNMNPSAYGKHLIKHAAAAGIPRIRVHDLRHSHASLLINLGVSPLVISERLGHEKVSTTLDIYGHLYPSKQEEVSEMLESIF